MIGMGLSGMAATRLIKEFGGAAFVSDFQSRDKLADQIKELESLGVSYEVDGHTDALLKTDFVVISPGVTSKSPIVKKLRDAGIPIFSEIEIGSWNLRGMLLGITGSNGKSTTTMMLHNILMADGQESIPCGNLGAPLCDQVARLSSRGYAVAEISSFQLEFIEQFAPSVAAILNISPDHLERHGSLKTYREEKLRITENQNTHDTLVLNAESSELDARSIITHAKKKYFGTLDALDSAAIQEDSRGVFLKGDSLCATTDGRTHKILETSELGAPGAHNIENAMAASSMALVCGVRPDSIRKALLEFRGLEHRLESIARVNGVHFVNDSKATNVGAAITAIGSVTAPIRLILGGSSTDDDFKPLAHVVSERVCGVVAIGDARSEIFDALGRTVGVEFADSMYEAVEKLFEAARPGETILLSQACDSLDMFEGFAHRGKCFKDAVSKIAGRFEGANAIGN